MAVAWDTTAIARLSVPGRARDLARDRFALADPVGLPAPCLLELSFGYRRALDRGDRRFAGPLRWVQEEMRRDPLGLVLPLDGTAASLAGELRAILPVPPGKRPRSRSKAESRVAWMLDIEIAAAAWAAGFDIATGNRSDFEAIAAAINDLAPGGVPFGVVAAEVL